MPSFESFQAQVPSFESFQSQIPSFESFQAQLDIGDMDTLQSEIVGKIGIDPSVLSGGFGTSLTPGNIVKEIGSKVGVNIDSEKVDKVIKEIDDFKQAAKAKAINSIIEFAKSKGIDIPELPTEGEIESMITEKAMNIPEVADAVDKINSKMTSLTDQFIPDIDIQTPEIPQFEQMPTPEEMEAMVPQVPELNTPDVSFDDISALIGSVDTSEKMDEIKSGIEQFIKSKFK